MRMQTERSKIIKFQTRPLGRGRATPSLFLANPSKIVRLHGDFNRITLSHQYLAAPLRMTCSKGVIFVILLVGAIRNVFEENLRLAKQSPLDRRGRRSLQVLINDK